MTLAKKPTWRIAQPLLSTFDGAASELFVIDLPESRLSHVLGVIASLPDVAWTYARMTPLSQREH
jgi:hypothetical protein